MTAALVLWGKRLLPAFLPAVLFAACTTVIRKPLKPELAVPVDSIAVRLGHFVGAQNVSLNGEDVTTNGKESTELEIDIVNGQNLSPDQGQLRRLGLNIAGTVREALTNKGQFDSYRVVFAKVDSGSAVTKRSWTAFTYKATEL